MYVTTHPLTSDCEQASHENDNGNNDRPIQRVVSERLLNEYHYCEQANLNRTGVNNKAWTDSVTYANEPKVC